jgi:glucose/arabinose dehydrogenase
VKSSPAAVLALVVIAGLSAGDSRAQGSGIVRSEKEAFRVVTLVEGLEHPWGLAFLPDGRLLVTERPGRLRIVRDGTLDPRPVEGLPEIAAVGQGGLLDVALHPRYAATEWIYLSYAAASATTGSRRSRSSSASSRSRGPVSTSARASSSTGPAP